MFTLLFVARIGGGRRRVVSRYGPPIIMGALAAWMTIRAEYWAGAVIACAALAAWQFGQPRERPAPAPPVPDSQDTYARAVLGVGATATAADIRAAFRKKMAAAHPDRGGGHEAAARLVAARDRLLRRR